MAQLKDTIVTGDLRVTGTIYGDVAGGGSTATTATLTSAGWSSNTQTVTVSGVTTTNNVLISASPSSTEDYVAAGILCTAQAANSLTFTCITVPSNDITVNVLIFS